MTSSAVFARLALSFPQAEERDHRGHPAFCVGGKIFSTLWPDERRGVVKLPIDDQKGLVASSPRAFGLNAWSKQGWTEVYLDNVTPKECKQVLEEAWRHVAPKKLAKAFDAEKEAT